ncbi:MAG: tetratricopeptide repeat protein [Bacteroidetes bacterium]|nr:tetratricopeptide repeat protein [Bacteroidota bacterium]
MEQIGINSNVYAGGKIFHIQSSGNINDLTVQAEIFEAGRIITVEKKKLDSAKVKPSADEFAEFLKTFHNEVSWEIELMFFMRDKIRTTSHTVSNNKIGLLFMHKGLLDEAISEFTFTIEKSPEMVEAYSNLGTCYLQKGDPKSAIEILRRATNLRPTFPDLKNSLGLALIKAHRFDEAQAEFSEALRINPNYIIVYLNIALAHLENLSKQQTDGTLPAESKLKASVIEIFQKTLATNPDFSNYRFYSYRFEKIIKAVEAGTYALAIETIEDVRNSMQGPNLDETIHGFYLRFLFGGAGKDEKVLTDYRHKLEEHIEENPTYADLRNSLGLVYLIQCRNLFLKAMAEFKKAYEINPEYKSAYKNFRLVQNDGREFLNLLRAILK